MDLATGAMGSLLPKLVELVKDEYKLQTGVKKDVDWLSQELSSMQAALRKVGEVPWDQLDKQVKLWADEIRELSYDMEDTVDKFLVRVEGADSDGFKKLIEKIIEKMCDLFKKGKTRHQIADAIKDMKDQVQDVAARRDRYKIDDVAAKHAAATVVDPRLKAMYKDVSELVGIDGKRDHELIKLLSEGEDDDVSKKKLKIVSIVGFGGLGKTTLARAVYNKIKGGFDCSAFVPVGRKPDAKKVLRDILLDLDSYTNSNLAIFDEKQLIDELRKFLEKKRYLIVIDDIWDKDLWRNINCAFSNVNTRGSRLITTTRNISVSEACCSSNDDIYKMKPLSDDESQMLFYKRIFSSEDGCPHELEQVSRDILKKCGGVPLAIITIASLLASDGKIKPKDQWLVLLNSIGRGLTEDSMGRGLTEGASGKDRGRTEGASVKDMKMILSLSYYDLPSHLKNCLLYLSIFPEDYEIERERLIWRWIAEGFVQCGKQESSLFEIGESYFNELINRSMIQPVYNRIGGVEFCRVHDMVLDLICSLSSEENFVAILDGTEQSPPNSQSKVRRLSLQGCKLDRTTTLGSLRTSQVRSVTIFEAAINLMPPLSSFDVLRVLDLEGCDLGESDRLNLRDVGNLCHLRYLDLRNTCIWELPAEIGKLQFLQVLDLSGNDGLKEIPSTVAKLRRLMCLCLPKNCKWLPDGLGSLTSLEVLHGIRASLDIVTELRNLTRMRELCIRFEEEMSLETEEAFVESLCNLQNLQSLSVRRSFQYVVLVVSVDLLGERWVPPPHLRRFEVFDFRFSALPAWIKRNPSHLSDLTELIIKLKEVQQEDLRILGRLPALRYIRLSIWEQTQRLLLIDGFPCTVEFHLYTCGVIMFQPGALPSAEYVDFGFSVRAAKDEGKGDFDLGLGNLPSLRECHVIIHTEGATVGEAKEAEAALRHAADVHPNHPTIHIYFTPSIRESSDEEY